MCGRYSLIIADLGELARRFEFDGNWLTFDSSYNIAPTQEVLTVVGGESRRDGYMRWGLIPFVGQGPIHRKPYDQRAGGDGRREARLSHCSETTADAWCSPTASTSGRSPVPAGGPCGSSCGQKSLSPLPDSGRRGGTRRAKVVPSCTMHHDRG